MNNLMIADDDLNFSKQLFNNIIQKNKEIRLCNISTNGKEAISAIKALDKSDIVLLDLKLPKLDGIELLKDISDLPYIIVISGNIEQLYQEKEALKVVCGVISKPVDYDKLEKIIKELTLKEQQEMQKEFIIQQLNKFRFNQNSKAFGYLVETLLIAIMFRNDVDNIEKNIYVKVAKRYKTKAINVKWSIEKLITSMYLNTNSKIICEYFNFYEERKPTTKCLINTIIDKYEKAKE